MGDVNAEETPSESEKADNSRTLIIQVLNVSPSATLEQLSTLFGYLGDISKIEFFQPDQTPENNSKVCFVQFASSSSVLMAQHLTNTVFIDRALTVIPHDEPIFPSQDSTLASVTSTKFDRVREYDKKNDHGRYKYHNRQMGPRDSHSHGSRSREIIQRRSRSSERVLRRSRSKDRDHRRRSRSKDRDHRRRSRSKDRDHRRRSRSKDRDHRRRSRSKDRDHRRRSRSKDRDHRRSKSRESKKSSRARSSDRSKTKRHKF